MNKKLLIITYYWPPSGGIGVLRCLKFAKYLSNLGWDITVFTVKNGQYPYIDHSNDKDIPKDIKVIRSNIWEPYNLYKIFSQSKKDINVNNIFSSSDKKRGWVYHFSVWIRSNFFIPDARSKWIKPSVTFLEKYLIDHPVDIILSNGPPHTNTRIACLLKKKLNIPWHADFQDPWSQVDYFSQLHFTKWGKKRHLAMEQEAFHFSDSMSIVSPTWKQEIEAIGAKKVSVLEWGFDSDDYSFLTRVPDKKFTLSHIGIMGFDRNPTVLFEVLKDLVDQNKDFSEYFELKLLGEVDLTVKTEIEKFELQQWVNYMGSVSRKDAIQETINSQVLLLLLNQQPNAKGRIPGKLFEYLAVARPILVLGPGKCDSGDIVENSNSGRSLKYKDKTEIKTFILELFSKYKGDDNFAIEQKNISDYNVKNITFKLDTILRQHLKE